MPAVPTGRIERRIPKAEVVELFRLSESPIEKVEAVTENVSPGGARLITDFICVPGRNVRLVLPEEHLRLPARVVYCQRAGQGKFAVGLQLDARVDDWRAPPYASSF